MIRRFFLATIALAIATTIAAPAADLTPSTVLASASTHNLNMVTVTGKVSNYQTKQTGMGTVALFQLCDTKCVQVLDQKNTMHKNGDSATVTGYFYIDFKTRKRTYNNVIDIK
jgi:hypothetical protein